MLVLPKNILEDLVKTKNIWEIMELYWCTSQAVERKFIEYNMMPPTNFYKNPPINMSILEKRKLIGVT